MASSPKNEEEDEELDDMPEEKKARDPLRHARIKRIIESRTFTGYVEDIEVGRVSGDVLYRVRYSDGDVEHFTVNMVREMQDLEVTPQLKEHMVSCATRTRRGVGKSTTQTQKAMEATGAVERGTPGKNPPEVAEMDVEKAEEDEEGEEEEQGEEEEKEEEEEEGEEEDGKEPSKRPASTIGEAGEGDEGTVQRRPAGLLKKPAAAQALEAETVLKKPAAAMDEEEDPQEEEEWLPDGVDDAVEEEDEDAEEEEEAEDEEQGKANTVLKKPAAKVPVQKEISREAQAKTAARAKGVFKKPAAK